MGFLERSLEMLFNTIKYNGLYIFLSLLFPLMFYKLDAGREIVLFLLNDKQQYNISLIAFSFSLISLAIWCIPVLAIDYFKIVTDGKVDKNELFEKLDNNYNGTIQESVTPSNNKTITPQIPVKYLSIFPWIIFVSTMAVVFYNNKALFFVGIICCVAPILLVNILIKRNVTKLRNIFWEKEPKKWVFFYSISGFFIIYLLLPFLFRNYDQHRFALILYYILGFVMHYSFIYLYDLIRKLEIDDPLDSAAQQGKPLAFNYQSARLIHLGVIVSVIVLLVVFYIYNQNANLGEFNPIVVSVAISCFLILGFEFFISSQILIVNMVGNDTLKLKLYKFAVIIGSVVLLYAYFFSSFNNHLIRKENIANYEKTDYDRLKLEDYFQKWYDEKNTDLNNNQKDSVFTVYLVSGQGGGSRAGAWFLMNMLYMDAKNASFYDHVFSISTVSGSSSGANMYYAMHQLGTVVNPNRQQYDETTKKTDSITYNKIKNFTKNIYNRNYLNSGIFGLILNDFSVDALTNSFFNERKDRNYTLQKEELKAFEESYFRLYPTGMQQEKNDSKKRSMINDSLAKIKTIRNYFEGDFLSIYKNNFSNPLFFLNTTIIDDGTKGIFSPVKMGFSMFRDLYGDYRMCNASDNYALPMVACVNQSQAFPMMNAYSYLHGSGRLGDGGMYENSGTETTLEIYKTLRKYCDEKKIKVEFVLLNLMNSKINGRQNNDFSKASYLNTLSAMANNPFFGHEFIAYEKLKNEITNPTDFISIIPENKYTLTRMLSAATIDSLFKNITVKNKTISDNALNKISRGYKSSSETDSAAIDGNLTKVFIQYSGQVGLATRLKQNLTKKGYKVQALDFVPSENSINSVRYFHDEDEGLAKRLRYEVKLQTKRNVEVENFGKIYPFVPKKQIEVWLAE